ncbi:MAG TPA: tetratricopeptide repeat protein [Actinomycetales bacterium]|nr:tetratricopeptide repeat protein [Actinomycetales bacterium]
MSQGPTSGQRINLRGAVDLSGLARSGAGTAGATGPTGTTTRAPGGQPAAGAPSGGFTGPIVDVTEATFGDVVQLSMSVPVVVDLWATWCGPCKQLSPVLEKLAIEAQGAFLLAKVDVDANQQISAAFGVQSIPTVVAILKGQPVPLFQGALPESQVKQVLGELMKVAEANGVTGRVPVGEQTEADDAAEPAEEPLPPLHQEAYDAIERGDMEAAADAYRRAIAQNPGDAMAKAGLGQVELLRRAAGADLQQARAAAAENPDDIDAQMLCADLDLLGGHVEDAFSRLIEVVRRTSGDDREKVRVRLVDLFEVVGPDDPRVSAARRALASALF